MTVPLRLEPAASPDAPADLRARGPAEAPGTDEERAARRAGGLSPSRAADFARCPLLYRFRVLDRLPEAPTEAAVRGTLVHAVLDRLFDLPAPQRTVEAARALVEPEWRALREREPRVAGLFPAPGGDGGAGVAATGDGAVDEAGLQRWLASAGRLLERWFELEDPTRLEPSGRELWVEAPLEGGPVLRGIVDRVDESAAGDLRVVDYKTGRAPSEAFESAALFQLRFYALALWRSRGVVPRVLQLVYLGSGEVLRVSPDEDDLRATERKVRALWEAIEQARRDGDWRPNPGRACRWCDHKARCPAFGGTPPPLPLLPVPPVPAAADGPGGPDAAARAG